MKMNRVWIALVPLVCALSCLAQQSSEEAVVWKLEQSYWEDVKALNLASYRDLWHPNFVGWPYVSPQPVRKDHITDWITDNTAKGLHLESYSLKRGDSQATANLLVIHYWVTTLWADKDNRGEPHTLRITHTWIRNAQGWRIIGGMSAPEPETKK